MFGVVCVCVCVCVQRLSVGVGLLFDRIGLVTHTRWHTHTHTHTVMVTLAFIKPAVPVRLALPWVDGSVWRSACPLMADSKQPYQTAMTANGSQIRSRIRLNGNVNSLTSAAVEARGRWRRVLTVSLLLLRAYCVPSSNDKILFLILDSCRLTRLLHVTKTEKTNQRHSDGEISQSAPLSVVPLSVFT